MKLVRRSHIANWGKGGSLTSLKSSPLIFFFTCFLILTFSFQQFSFARKGNTGGMSSAKAFTAGAISAAVTAVGVGVGGVPAAVGTITSTYVGVYCYSQGYSRDKIAKTSILAGAIAGAATGFVAGVVGGLAGSAGGATGGSAGGSAGAAGGSAGAAGGSSIGNVILNSAVNAGITFASSYTGGRVSYELSKAGAHPALASAGGMLTGLGVGFGLSLGASAAGVPGFTKSTSTQAIDSGIVSEDNPYLVVTPKNANTHTFTISVSPAPTLSTSTQAIDSGIVSEDNPYLTSGMTAKYANTHTFVVPESSGSNFSFFSLPGLQQLVNPWGRVAQMGVGRALITTVPRIAVSALVEAGVSEALGYDNDARKKGDILINRVASAVGSFAGGLAGGFAQAAVDTYITPEITGVSPKENAPTPLENYVKDLPQYILSGALTAGTKIGFAHLNRGIDYPGLAGLTNIVAGALGTATGREFLGGREEVLQNVKNRNENLTEVFVKVEGKPAQLNMADLNWKNTNFPSNFAEDFWYNLGQSASNALPTLGASSRIGEYAWEQDGFSVQPALNIINNVMHWSNFAQTVGRGISPCDVIAGNFDSSGYYVASDNLGQIYSKVLAPVIGGSKWYEVKAYVPGQGIRRAHFSEDDLRFGLRMGEYLVENLQQFKRELEDRGVPESLRKDLLAQAEELLSPKPILDSQEFRKWADKAIKDILNPIIQAIDKGDFKYPDASKKLEKRGWSFPQLLGKLGTPPEIIKKNVQGMIDTLTQMKDSNLPILEGALPARELEVIYRSDWEMMPLATVRFFEEGGFRKVIPLTNPEALSKQGKDSEGQSSQRLKLSKFEKRILTKGATQYEGGLGITQGEPFGLRGGRVVPLREEYYGPEATAMDLEHLQPKLTLYDYDNEGNLIKRYNRDLTQWEPVAKAYRSAWNPQNKDTTYKKYEASSLQDLEKAFEQYKDKLNESIHIQTWKKGELDRFKDIVIIRSGKGRYYSLYFGEHIGKLAKEFQHTKDKVKALQGVLPALENFAFTKVTLEVSGDYKKIAGQDFPHPEKGSFRAKGVFPWGEHLFPIKAEKYFDYVYDLPQVEKIIFSNKPYRGSPEVEKFQEAYGENMGSQRFPNTYILRKFNLAYPLNSRSAFPVYEGRATVDFGSSEDREVREALGYLNLFNVPIYGFDEKYPVPIGYVYAESIDRYGEFPTAGRTSHNYGLYGIGESSPGNISMDITKVLINRGISPPENLGNFLRSLSGLTFVHIEEKNAVEIRRTTEGDYIALPVEGGATFQVETGIKVNNDGVERGELRDVINIKNTRYKYEPSEVRSLIKNIKKNINTGVIQNISDIKGQPQPIAIGLPQGWKGGGFGLPLRTSQINFQGKIQTVNSYDRSFPVGPLEYQREENRNLENLILKR